MNTLGPFSLGKGLTYDPLPRDPHVCGLERRCAGTEIDRRRVQGANLTESPTANEHELDQFDGVRLDQVRISANPSAIERTRAVGAIA
jgi:hypothetical protein